MIEEWLEFLRDNHPDHYADAMRSANHSCKWRDERIAALEGERVWQPMETAPKGYLALKEPSEWFLAQSAKKYNGPTSANVAVIRRVFGIGFGPWEGSGEEYYKEDYFTHWMPLPKSPEGKDE